MEEIRSYKQLEEVVKQTLGNKFDEMFFSEKCRDEILINLKNIEEEFWYEDIRTCEQALEVEFANEWIEISTDEYFPQISIRSPKFAAYSIMRTFEPYVIKSESEDGYSSILIGDKNSSYQTWVDKNDSDGSLYWNKNIFCLSNSNDVIEREMQYDESVWFAVDALI